MKPQISVLVLLMISLPGTSEEVKHETIEGTPSPFFVERNDNGNWGILLNVLMLGISRSL
jgi:hypothetical protein